MEQAVFRGITDDPVDVWKCSSSESCRQARKVCKACGHKVSSHYLLDKYFGDETIPACAANMGQGDPCGCQKSGKRKKKT